MKAFYVVLLLVFLASCGSDVAPNTSVDPVTPVSETELQEEVGAEIDAEAEKIIEELIEIADEPESEELSDSEENSETSVPEPIQEEVQEESVEAEETQQVEQVQEESEPLEQVAAPKVVELSTTYTNPAGLVNMSISYSLDSDGKISEISVTSPDYQGMNVFSRDVQSVIGMSVSEASEYYVSGSSLTTPAFQKALKNG